MQEEDATVSARDSSAQFWEARLQQSIQCQVGIRNLGERIESRIFYKDFLDLIAPSSGGVEDAEDMAAILARTHVIVLADKGVYWRLAGTDTDDVPFMSWPENQSLSPARCKLFFGSEASMAVNWHHWHSCRHRPFLPSVQQPRRNRVMRPYSRSLLWLVILCFAVSNLCLTASRCLDALAPPQGYAQLADFGWQLDDGGHSVSPGQHKSKDLVVDVQKRIFKAYKKDPDARSLPSNFYEDSVCSQELLRKLLSGEEIPRRSLFADVLCLVAALLKERRKVPHFLPDAEMRSRVKQEQVTQVFRNLKRQPIRIVVEIKSLQRLLQRREFRILIRCQAGGSGHG